MNIERGNMKNIHTIPLSVGILAGGKSTRMGQNKALMKFHNDTMIERISRQFRGSHEVLISAAEKGLYEETGLRVVYDENDSIGPIEGIRRLLSEAKEEYVFICAADMPFVNRQIAEYLSEFISSDYDCYVVEDDDHVHPLLAIYSKKILPVIEELIARGKYKLIEILNATRTKYVRLENTTIDPRVVKNVNTKEEFLKLSLPVCFAVSGYHNSGKTGLIEKLINEFIKVGYTVGVLKHDGQDHIKYAAGTDTDRFHKAGAACSMITSDSGFLLRGSFSKSLAAMGDARQSAEDGILAESHDPKDAADPADIASPDDPGQLLGMFSHFPNPPDILIAEGFKTSALPKIEVVRREVFDKSVCDPETLICIVTDCKPPEEVSCPVFSPGDIRGIFSCLQDYFFSGDTI